MTAEEKKQIAKLAESLQCFEKKSIERLTRIETNLTSYHEVKKQVYENKESISKVKTVWSTIVGIAFLIQAALVIYTTQGGTP